MKFFRLAFVIVLGFLIAGCDIYQPSSLCGEETEADHAAFSQYFSDMQLVNSPGSDSENTNPQVGRVFVSPVSLVLESTLLQESEVRLCIFGAKMRGEVVFDETFTMGSGTQSFKLGEFQEGPFIIRVYANGKLVENISFIIQ